MAKKLEIKHIEKEEEEMEEEMDLLMSNAEFLRDLSGRLMHVPVMYGTDQHDCDRLKEIAATLEEVPDAAQ